MPKAPTTPRYEPPANLPNSGMKYPTTIAGWLLYCFWYVYTPFHVYVRDTALALGIVHFDKFLDSKGRQQFLIGVIAPNVQVDQVISHLVARGYGNHFVAWNDAGEIASLRVSTDFEHQYHIRIFEDGEVRGHFELTPEAHPWKHYYEIGMEKRAAYFQDLLGDLVTQSATT